VVIIFAFLDLEKNISFSDGLRVDQLENLRFRVTGRRGIKQLGKLPDFE